MNNSGQKLYKKAKQIIPGGTQLLSKRPEMFLPDYWPAYYRKAKGVDIWDLDGNHYVDMNHNGIGTCILGAADPDVDGAVQAAIQNGVMSTLNCPEEVALAELLCELHPWAEMVRYARTGGEAMSIAVRIARAKTKREKVLFCGYHGWHDWYLAANLAEDTALDGHLLGGLMPLGVPRSLRGTTIPFTYNDLAELKLLAETHKEDVAAIVMEPMRSDDPAPGFLEGVRDIATEIGAVLIFDECTSAFRQNTGGVHLRLGVSPDIAMFAKAMSNGYPMAAIIGRGQYMSAAEDTFISSTYWTERIGPTAALATIEKYQRCNVAAHLKHIGSAIQNGWKIAAERVGLPIHVGGIEPLSHFEIEHEQAQVAQTFFVQKMLDQGFLASASVYVTYAHQNHHVESYLTHTEDIFKEIVEGLETGSLLKQLKGSVAHSGFQRLIS